MIRLVISLMLTLTLAGTAFGEITYPMETAATGFFFLDDSAWAAGLSHTLVRAQVEKFRNISLDLDATFAQKLRDSDTDLLYGIGLKLNTFIVKETKSGFNVMPSVGVTALSNIRDIKTFKDIADSVKWALYGSIILYKW